MEREVDIVVEVRGRRWTFTDAFYDAESGEFSYGEIVGPCAEFLPKELVNEIDQVGQEAAYRDEQERQQEAAEARFDK